MMKQALLILFGLFNLSSALLGECQVDCDKDTDCSAGLVCANNRAQELKAKGFDGRKAYCDKKIGKQQDEVCYNETLTKVYVAEIAPIPGVTSNIKKGTAVVKLMNGGMVYYYGSVKFVEPNLIATGSNCNVTNGCGSHIHGGSACDNRTVQGEHFFVPPVTVDPWVNQRYSSNAKGLAKFDSKVTIGTTAVEGKTFIIHAANGTRVGCGILKEVDKL